MLPRWCFFRHQVYMIDIFKRFYTKKSQFRSCAHLRYMKVTIRNDVPFSLPTSNASILYSHFSAPIDANINRVWTLNDKIQFLHLLRSQFKRMFRHRLVPHQLTNWLAGYHRIGFEQTCESEHSQNAYNQFANCLPVKVTSTTTTTKGEPSAAEQLIKFDFQIAL